MERSINPPNLHSPSNFMSSSEVQTTTSDMPRSTQRVSRPWFLSYTSCKDNNAKTAMFSRDSNQPQPNHHFPRLSLNNIQPCSGLPSNNDVHVSSTTGEAKPGPIRSAPFKTKFEKFESGIYRRPKGSWSKQNEGDLDMKLPG